MNFASLSKPGTLIHARGREWVVLPESGDDILIARPIGGLDEEITGIMPAIETVQSATFSLPSRLDLGDFSSGRLLREAARLSTRAAAGLPAGTGQASLGEFAEIAEMIRLFGREVIPEFGRV